MKKRYLITLDEHLVKELKQRGIALSTMLNMLLAEKICGLKKSEISIEDVAKEYAELKEKHKDKTIEQIDILIKTVSNADLIVPRTKELKLKALQMLKQEAISNETKTACTI